MRTTSPLPVAPAALLLIAAPATAQGFEAERPSLAPPSALQGATLGDVDGDGDLDVVSFGAGPPAVAWSENLGQLDFVAPRAVLDDPAFTYVRQLEAVDLDGDGDDDLVIADTSMTRVGWIESLGGGSYGPVQALGPSTGFVADIVTTDWNGDGRADVVAIRDGRDVEWFENLGAGQFAVAVQLASTSGRYSDVIAADLDADGDLDLVVAEEWSEEALWIENLGGGAGGVAAVLAQTPNDPDQLVATDMDGDGDVDLALVYSTFSFSTGTAAWAENAGGLSFGAFVHPIATDVFGLTFADVDADGADDALIGHGQFGSIEVARNVGGTFATSVVLESEQSYTHSVLAGDLDADGDVDVVSASILRIELHERATGTFERGRRLVFSLGSTFAADLGDLDGDGIDDLATIDRSGSGSFGWQRSLGGGTWSETETTYPLTDPLQVEVIDLDADGDLDLLAAGGSYDQISAEVAWAENTGSGAFGPKVTLHADLADGGARFRVGDMDGDGDLDVLWNHREGFGFDQRFEWSEQVSAGVFASGLVLPDDSLSVDFELADVDGDGDADVVEFHRFQGREVAWRANDGTGAFGPSQVIRPAGATSGDGVAVGDLDGDGAPDVVTFGGGVDWYRALPGGAFAGPFAIEPPTTSSTRVLLGDVNRDGHVDVFVSSLGAPARWFENLGAGTFAASRRLLEDEPGSHVVELGDLDGDLDLDVLKRTASLRLAWNRNKARFGDAYCGPARPNSTGAPGRMSARGSRSIADDDVRLIVEHLPASSFGYFLVAPLPGFVPLAGGSSGNLCVGGPIGRLNRGPNEIFRTNAAGRAERPLDVTDVPTPTGSVALVPGDTAYFQAWHRDANPGVTSNLTNGLAITFE